MAWSSASKPGCGSRIAPPGAKPTTAPDAASATKIAGAGSTSPVSRRSQAAARPLAERASLWPCATSPGPVVRHDATCTAAIVRASAARAARIRTGAPICRRAARRRWLRRHQLECRRLPLPLGEAADPALRRLRVVLRGVGLGDGPAEPLAPDVLRADGDLRLPEGDRPARLLAERAEPARRLVVPRAHEDAALDDDHPHPGEPVAGAGAHAEDLEPLELVELPIRE